MKKKKNVWMLLVVVVTLHGALVAQETETTVGKSFVWEIGAAPKALDAYYFHTHQGEEHWREGFSFDLEITCRNELFETALGSSMFKRSIYSHSTWNIKKLKLNKQSIPLGIALLGEYSQREHDGLLLIGPSLAFERYSSLWFCMGTTTKEWNPIIGFMLILQYKLEI